MNSKFVLLLLTALQVSYASEWKRPHIRYYSRWAKHRPDSYEEQSSGSNYESHHQSSNYCHDDIKPVHEDHEPSRRDSFLRDDEGLDGESAECRNHVLHDRRRPCEIYVNPIRPPYHGAIINHDRPGHDDCEVFVNPIRPPYGGPVNKHYRPEHDDCEVLVNPIRPPYEGPVNHLPVEDLSADCGLDRQHSELSEEGYHSNAGPSLGDVINSQFGPHSGRLSDRDVQASIADSGINEQIRAAALREDSSENAAVSASGPIGSFLTSGVELPFIGSPLKLPALPSPALPLPALPLPALLSRDLPSPNFCIRHRLVPVPVRVVEDCITSVPVVRKTLRHQVETVTRHVPVVHKTVTQQNEKIVRHVPVSGKTLRNVVETRVRHIPVIRSRTRTIVEPYTVHIPVTIRFTRPVEESITKTVPVQEVRTRPVVTQRTRIVPVIGRRIRPIVEQRVFNVPVKKKYLRTVVEQRVRPVVVPCQPCILPGQPIGLPLTRIPAEDIPRILLSPYSDFGGSIGATNSQLGAAISGLGASLPGGQSSSDNTLLPGPINEQIAALSRDFSGISNVRPNFSQESSLPLSKQTAHITPNHHSNYCSPPPPSC